MTDGKSASRVYVTNAKDTKDTRYIELVTADGAPYPGHTGGITAAGDCVWLANNGEGRTTAYGCCPSRSSSPPRTAEP